MYSAFLAAVLPAVFTGQDYSCSGGGYYANGGGYGFNYGGFAPQSYSAPRRFVRFEVGFGNGRRLSLAYDGGFRPGWGGGYQPFQALPAGYGYGNGGGFYQNGGYYQNGGSFPGGGFGPPRVFEGSSYGGVV